MEGREECIRSRRTSEGKGGSTGENRESVGSAFKSQGICTRGGHKRRELEPNSTQKAAIRQWYTDIEANNK